MATCSSCGQENPAIARFCLACGSPLAAGRAQGREERKVVSVLFVDLVGFTSRAERLDPEDVGALLAPYWERVRGELESHRGTVEKFIGDAVLGLFGAPVAREDDPERAVRAALAIRDGITESGGDELQLRLAVTTGEALVRLDARPLDGEGMVSGDVVNTASRLQAAAPANGILVDEATYRATRHVVEYEPAESVQAKGKRDPIAVWQAVSARSRFGVDVPTAYSTPLVGRLSELDELRRALARAREQRAPQLVTLVGVPGIGKSRLVHELSRAVDADAELVRWRQGRSLPYAEGASFWALAEMVKAEAGILETDPPAGAEAKLRASVDGAVEDEYDRERVAARLRPLVGLQSDAVGVDDRRSELFAAWRRYLEGLAERRATVLVFEDLHWADEGLLDFVDHLAEWASGVPLLVVATARPELLERRPGWGGGKRNAATLSLASLDDVETGRLVGALLGSSVLAAELQHVLVERAGGNPLYAEQFARMLDERGDAESSVPETVQGLIAARLDLLTREEKSLLQDASVLGKVFWLGAVAGIGGAERAEAEQLLHLLERKEFVERARRASVAGETEYAFRHILVRDVAYNQIPRAARAGKHRRAAEWIAALGRPEDHADLLAHHYLAALELARAAGVPDDGVVAAAGAAAVEAGDRAAALYAFGNAERFYLDALALAEPEPDPRLLYRLGRMQHELGRPGREPLLLRARDALLAAGDVEQAAEIGTRLAHAVWEAGDGDRSRRLLAEAAALIADRPPSEQTAYVHANQARFSMLASNGEDAVAAGEAALAIAEELGLEYLRAHLHVTVGVSRVLVGEPARGIAEAEEGIAIAERIGAVESIRGHLNLASVLSYVGRLDDSHRHHRRAFELAHAFGSVYSTIFLNGELARDHYLSGSWTDALAHADAVIDATRTTPHVMESTVRIVRAGILDAREGIAAARPELRRAVEVGLESEDPQSSYPVLAASAELLQAAGFAEEASTHCDELLGLTRRRIPHALEEWTVALALALRGLGRVDDVVPLLDSDRLRVGWHTAVAALARGDLGVAADALGAIGDRPHEARVRLLCDEPAQRARADAFHRSVGADRYVGPDAAEAATA